MFESLAFDRCCRVRKVKVVKTGFLRHCFHQTVKFVYSHIIVLALNQLSAEFFYTHIKGCISGLFMDSGLFSGSRSSDEFGVAKAVGYIGRTLRGYPQYLFFGLSENSSMS